MKPGRGEAGRLAEILRILEESGIEPRPGLRYLNPWQLLVATVLSAQCTDARVNSVTRVLFEAYPDPAALSRAPVEEVEGLIRSIGLFRNKAKNLVALAGMVVNIHAGRVPGVREELEKLPGVGRKTASVVLAQGFNVAAFAVDTHIGRVSYRLGFSKSTEPLPVERAVTRLIAPERWREAHLILIGHGRRTCRARAPRCGECPVARLCPWPQKTP